ncbi:nitroreductase [Anaerosolibacter carboniphilus]|uniref:Nitroreductase n=1 Tax=Anaerosolibacter carboniphilus TaxID=1417629 RepID=A0A841KQH9_9FIRM|nr:nitroreductase family protein [Anaerosolibacter carboniphilus]MBB6214368.1 nitroreductase [Anaerosolibacter carboniphilus]
MNETMKTILSRRSIRAFKDEQIKTEELQLILEAGQFAPSAMNGQPWHFTVVQNKELLHKINEACRTLLAKSGNKMFEERVKDPNFSVFYHAPTFIIISGDEKAMLAQIDCAVALQNMLLSAESLGIGSCWIHALASLFSTEEGAALRKELGIPDQYTPFCSGAFGYKAMEPTAPPRKEDIVSIIK